MGMYGRKWMEIRRYRHGEEDLIWEVYFAATRVSVARDYHAELIERWAPEKQDMNAWAERLAEKNPFVAVVEGQIVGMAEIERRRIHRLFLCASGLAGARDWEGVVEATGSGGGEVGSENDFCGCECDGEGVFSGEGIQDFGSEEECDSRTFGAEFSDGEMRTLRVER